MTKVKFNTEFVVQTKSVTDKKQSYELMYIV